MQIFPCDGASLGCRVYRVQGLTCEKARPARAGTRPRAARRDTAPSLFSAAMVTPHTAFLAGLRSAGVPEGACVT